MRITRKIPAIFAGMVTACCVAVGIGSYLVGENFVRSQAEARLMAIAESRKDTVLSSLTSVRSRLLLQAQGKTVSAALNGLKDEWGLTDGRAGSSFLKLYTSENPHPVLEQHVGESGLQDFLLANSAGRVVHSTRKLSGFTSDLRGAGWQASNLAKAFEVALAGEEGHAHFFDLQAYPANSNRPTSYMSAPVIEGGKAIGVLIHYVPTAEISTQLANYEDLGDTGNVFLVNENGLVQNDSLRTGDASELLYSSLSRSEVMSVLGRSRRLARMSEFLGTEVDAAVVPFEFQGRNYAIVVTQETGEIYASLADLRNLILGISAASGLAALLVGTAISRNLAGRVKDLSKSMSQIAEGNTSGEVIVRTDGDEIDELAATVAAYRVLEVRRQQLDVDDWVLDDISDGQGRRLKELVERFVADIKAA